HSCGKPLIVNIKPRVQRTIKQPSQEIEDFQNYETEEKYLDFNIVKDAELENKIREIDLLLEKKEASGDNLGRLLLEKAGLLYQKREVSSSIKILEIALKNFKEENELLNMAICYNELGLMKEEIGFYDDSLYNFERAIEILREIDEKEKLIQVYNNIGNIYYIIKDLEHSYEYYQKALKLAEKENLTLEELKTSSNLVDILFLLKDYERIEKILKRNLEFFSQTGDIYGTIISITKFGKLYYLRGENYYNLSYEKLNKALTLILKVADKISIFIKAQMEWECFLYLGKLNIIWDNLDEAESFLLKSLEAVRLFEFGESLKEGYVLESLGNLYEIKGDDLRAIESYNLSIEIYYKFGDDFKIAELKVIIGNIYLNFVENESHAIKYYEEALEIFENLGYSKESSEVLHKLGDIYVQRGIIELALNYFEKARKIYKVLQDQYHENLITEKIRSLKNINNQDNSF
ncbi:MAG: tetratricopeptide repeat protein, partial [Promethearchaeota archaeon]